MRRSRETRSPLVSVKDSLQEQKSNPKKRNPSKINGALRRLMVGEKIDRPLPEPGNLNLPEGQFYTKEKSTDILSQFWPDFWDITEEDTPVKKCARVLAWQKGLFIEADKVPGGISAARWLAHEFISPAFGVAFPTFAPWALAISTMFEQRLPVDHADMQKYWWNADVLIVEGFEGAAFNEKGQLYRFLHYALFQGIPIIMLSYLNFQELVEGSPALAKLIQNDFLSLT